MYSFAESMLDIQDFGTTAVNPCSEPNSETVLYAPENEWSKPLVSVSTDYLAAHSAGPGVECSPNINSFGLSHLFLLKLVPALTAGQDTLR